MAARERWGHVVGEDGGRYLRGHADPGGEGVAPGDLEAPGEARQPDAGHQGGEDRQEDVDLRGNPPGSRWDQ